MDLGTIITGLGGFLFGSPAAISFMLGFFVGTFVALKFFR